MTAVILAALLAASDPSAGATSAPSPQAAQQAKNDPNKVVCHWEDNYGSRMRTKTCKTRAQWDAAEANAQLFIKETMAKGAVSGSVTPTAMGQ